MESLKIGWDKESNYAYTVVDVLFDIFISKAVHIPFLRTNAADSIIAKIFLEYRFCCNLHKSICPNDFTASRLKENIHLEP